MSKERKNRIAKWGIFTVIFGIAPLLATYAIGPEDFSLTVLIGRGELFLISAVLMGDGLARVANEKVMSGWQGIVCLGALVLILGYAALEYGNAAKDLVGSKAITHQHIMLSVRIFCAAIGTGLAAVTLEA